MFNSPVVEIAIGLILIYLVLGLLCTSINEYVAQLLSLRAENLADVIYGMFSGKDADRFAEDVLNHPLVGSLSRKQAGMNLSGAKGNLAQVVKLPSSIPANIFSTVIKDLLKKQSTNRYDKEIIELLDLLEVPVATAATANVAKLESWYEDAMDRARGWYKKRVQVLSFMVSLGLVIVVNADTVMIVRQLTSMPVERAKLASYADQVKMKKDEAAKDANNAPMEAEEAVVLPAGLQNDTLSFLGWTDSKGSDLRKVPGSPMEWLFKIFGLSLTAFAASLGAPFWFDMLSKFMTVRSGGDPTPKKKES